MRGVQYVPLYGPSPSGGGRDDAGGQDIGALAALALPLIRDWMQRKADAEVEKRRAKSAEEKERMARMGLLTKAIPGIAKSAAAASQAGLPPTEARLMAAGVGAEMDVLPRDEALPDVLPEPDKEAIVARHTAAGDERLARAQRIQVAPSEEEASNFERFSDLDFLAKRLNEADAIRAEMAATEGTRPIDSVDYLLTAKRGAGLRDAEGRIELPPTMFELLGKAGGPDRTPLEEAFADVAGDGGAARRKPLPTPHLDKLLPGLGSLGPDKPRGGAFFGRPVGAPAQEPPVSVSETSPYYASYMAARAPYESDTAEAVRQEYAAQREAYEKSVADRAAAERAPARVRLSSKDLPGGSVTFRPEDIRDSELAQMASDADLFRKSLDPLAAKDPEMARYADIVSNEIRAGLDPKKAADQLYNWAKMDADARARELDRAARLQAARIGASGRKEGRDAAAAAREDALQMAKVKESNIRFRVADLHESKRQMEDLLAVAQLATDENSMALAVVKGMWAQIAQGGGQRLSEDDIKQFFTNSGTTMEQLERWGSKNFQGSLPKGTAKQILSTLNTMYRTRTNQITRIIHLQDKMFRGWDRYADEIRPMNTEGMDVPWAPGTEPGTYTPPAAAPKAKPADKKPAAPKEREGFE